MIPVNELLNKIKYDKSENPEEYEIYYYDRKLDSNLIFKLNNIMQMDGHFVIIIKSNHEVALPLNRIKEVRRQNQIIWKRE